MVPGPLVQRFYVDAIIYNKCMKIHFLIIVLRINNISKAFQWWLFQGAEKFGIVTITIHWKRISELMRGTGVKDSTDGNFSGKVKTVGD